VRHAKNPIVVVGLDLSLRRPAVAIMLPAWTPERPTKNLLLKAFEHEGVKDMDPAISVQRNMSINNRILEFFYDHLPVGPMNVFVEDYAYGMAAGSSRALQLAELAGIVKLSVWTTFGVVVKPINSTIARKMFLGKLPKGKGAAQKAVQDAAIALGMVPKGSGSDEADAFVVANAGRAELGFPFACIG
jgi:hypothetical protein